MIRATLRLVIIISFFSLSVALNAGQYGMAGCGLGSLIFKENRRISQLFVSFTNNTYSNQTLSITSGTSNCTTSGIVNKDKEQEVFVHLNYESLEREIAAGKGEKLDTLASLFGCPNSSNFNKIAKARYNNIFLDSEADPSILLSAIRSEIQKNDSLRNTCKI